MLNIAGLYECPLQDMCADVAIFESLLRMFFRSNRSTTEADMLSEHIDGLYSYALALSRNRVDAEDLVQETYIRAIPAAGWLRKENNVKSWMFTILRNIWDNQLRQPHVAVQVPGSDIDQILPVCGARANGPHSLLLTSLDQDQIRQAISRLPIDCREIILLREFEDFSYQEIAGVLKCPIGTVRSRLGGARSKLRALLSSALAGERSGEPS
jgi:RNA polymerase sigma-70 factor (ECF subfamily)